MTPIDGVGALLDALAAADIPHMVTGGLVANAHGISRSTKDADIVIQVRGPELAAFERRLPAGLRLDPQISFETITGSQRQIVEVAGTPFRIELFFLGSDPHHQERFRRRVWQHLPDLERDTWISTAEDMIIQKIRWWRDKDRDDARNILAVQGDALDFAYIEKWCDLHGTRSRLDDLRRSIPRV
jgi:hypothetical protein